MAIPGLAGDAFANRLSGDVVLRERGRGGWDDEFDGRGLRSVFELGTETPTFGGNASGNLEKAIAAYQDIVARGGWPTVGSLGRLRVGDKHAAIPALRQRLAASGDLLESGGAAETFDTMVDEALRRFQARHGLSPQGEVDRSTLAAMNVPAALRLGQLRTNLARVVEIGSEYEPRYVSVNIPDAGIEVVEGGRVIARHRAIVGRIDRATPVLSSRIHEVILNPYWTSPRSIVEKDIMPLMRKDPDYLRKNAIRLLDGKGNEVDPSSIDWHGDAPALTFRQDPGKINAMASTKINFPNTHATYMHDTPQQGLFNKLARFDSSGCVRVQNIRDLSTWLLRDTPGWERQAIEETIHTRVNTPIRLSTSVPIHFRYATAWAAQDGVVQFRDDIYHRDGSASVGIDNDIDQD
jgi:murein L,D-transpeptidase YcbB/YkuD